MKKVTYIVSVIILIIAALGCSTTANFTSHPADAGINENIKHIYALPETVVKVSVEAERTVTIPGPYHMYAEDLLGIVDIPHEKKVEWRISSIHLETYQKADGDHFYVIQSKSDIAVPSALEKMASKDMVVMPENMAFSSPKSGVEPDESNYIYDNVSSKPMVGEETDTLYKTLYKDSVFVKIPVYRTIMSQMTEEEKATEASHYIFNLRQSLFELFTGEMDFYPDGHAAEVIASEFRTLEQEYLNLFTGVEFTQNFQRSFTFIPDEGNKLKRAILFRFSADEGFHNADGITGRPVFIDVVKTGETEKIESVYQNKVGNPAENVIYYRIPDEAIVTILKDTREIYKSRVPVSQFGAVMPYSVRADH